MVIHLDFETRSRADLTSVGAHRYASDPSTEILMAAVSSDEPDAPVYLWANPKYETADMISDPEACQLLRMADEIYAHNAPFEQAITWGCRAEKLFGMDPIMMSQWRCTAAIARKAGLPWSLEKVSEALGLAEKKDARGKKLIKLFSEPQKDGSFVDPKAMPVEWAEFGDYCRQDVRTEKAVHRKLKAFELQGATLASFQFDLRMNQRGIPVNVRALENAQRIIDSVQSEVSTQFREITGLNPTQRDKVIEWLKINCWVEMGNMQAETVEFEIGRLWKKAAFDQAQAAELSGQDAEDSREMARRCALGAEILTMYQKLSYAAVKKVRTMLDCVCSDGVVRGGHLWYGAGTGRWSGRLVQPQNFKKTPSWMKSITDVVYRQIDKGASAEALDCIYGDPLELIAGCIRHFIQSPGGKFFDGDYNAVEARIIDWRAGQQDMVKMWRDNVDIYKFMAAEAYRVPVTNIDGDLRQHGKVLKLACGFGMGPAKYLSTCEMFGIECDAEKAERDVATYRRLHPKVVQYWYTLDHQCRAAIASPGSTQGPFTVRNAAGLLYLFLKLPSDRVLAYPLPMIEKIPGDDRSQITYWGQLPMSTQWGRVKLYGGKLAENETQAIAADIMSHGAREAEEKRMPPFMLVHDQALALKTNGQTPKDFEAALGDLPPWAKGLPLKVETKLVPYYLK